MQCDWKIIYMIISVKGILPADHFRILPLWTCLPSLPLSKQSFLNPPVVSLVALLWLSPHPESVQNVSSFMFIFTLEKSQKLTGVGSSEWGGWEHTMVLQACLSVEWFLVTEVAEFTFFKVAKMMRCVRSNGEYFEEN